MSEELSLKWGTIKSWNNLSENSLNIINKIPFLSMSAMGNRHNMDERKILCELIDQLNADTIYLEWDGIDVSKEKAKEYIMNYGLVN